MAVPHRRRRAAAARAGSSSLRGHAVEARIYAEDPARGFLPSTGKLLALQFPDGVRIDTGVEQGSAITPFYDPMIAKMIAHGPTREAALDQLAGALERTVGCRPAHQPGAARGALPCARVSRRALRHRFHRPQFGSTCRRRSRPAAAAFGAARLLAREAARIRQNLDRAPDEPPSPWDAGDGFQLGGSRDLAFPLEADGELVEAQVSYGPNGGTVAVDGVAAALDASAIEAADAVYVLRNGRQTVVRPMAVGSGALDLGDGSGPVRAPMHGKVLALLVANGDKVEKGQRLAIIEAMKMEHTLTATRAGRVAAIAVAAGSQVAEGATMMTVESIDA